MIKITKAQRDQLIAVAIGGVAVIAGLVYFVVFAQEKELKTIKANQVKTQAKLNDESAQVREAQQVGQALTNSQEALRQREVNFAPEREPQIWLVGVMQHFCLPTNDLQRYRSLSILDIKPPEITDKGDVAGFPYKWAKFHITAQGYYHDFGRFTADFENSFRYFRIQDLEITAPLVRQDPDMLSYSFDIVAPQVSAETK
jgi:Tfp pilus assembly protein PilO